MQALALLCTLHADGPATLRRLHRAGCTSLERLEAYPPQELAEILEIPPAVARRLGREARSLADRLDLRGFGDREESPEIAAPAGSFEAPAGASAGAGLDRRDRAVLGRVLDRWRTTAPSLAAGLSETENNGVTPAEQAFLEAVEPAPEPEPEVATPAPAPPAPPAPRIAAHAIDGLDEDLGRRLAREGIVDLAGLAAAESLTLSRTLGLAYGRVRRLQFLASRALPDRDPEVPREAPVEPSIAAAPAAPAERVQPVPAAEVAQADLRRPAPGEHREPIREVSAREVPTREPLGGEIPRVIDEEPVPRKFWEPRIQAREQALRSPAPAHRPEPEPRTPSASQPQSVRAGTPPVREGVALDWRFELYPPPPPGAEAGRKTAARMPGEAGWGAGVNEGAESFALGDEGAAGPFA